MENDLNYCKHDGYQKRFIVIGGEVKHTILACSNVRSPDSIKKMLRSHAQRVFSMKLHSDQQERVGFYGETFIIPKIVRIDAFFKVLFFKKSVQRNKKKDVSEANRRKTQAVGQEQMKKNRSKTSAGPGEVRDLFFANLF